MVSATEVFLMVFRQSDVMVGSTMRKALGSSTWRYSCGRVRPSARPAMPVRCARSGRPAPIACAVNAAVATPSAIGIM